MVGVESGDFVGGKHGGGLAGISGGARTEGGTLPNRTGRDYYKAATAAMRTLRQSIKNYGDARENPDRSPVELRCLSP
ncbi:Hypothetical protein Rmet_6683 (plasmid) [Cupriavidus metallidurans CH34]|uniref:Uncharacterized protein n=1 Tax=Cupriavidus metallidurans (strain ATCC 43123 / DSM 2839 / NBRC 102507 / CH34) TaxID=266264 RepID=D3DYA1_CUPMC|nr:Hypothetical protein Rmet_6683 [Cupriavidus metallidurans CH34]